MRGHFHLATAKKGYSGVGIYTRHEPSEVIAGYGSPEFDEEGRYLEARFDTPQRKFSVISCYFPSGSSGPERQEAKYRFLAEFYPVLHRLKAERDFVLCGDVNVAHQQIDLKNWKSNQKNSGFLPEERAWVTRVIDELQLHVVPYVVGDGLRLFDRLPPIGSEWAIADAEQGEGALHARYRRR